MRLVPVRAPQAGRSQGSERLDGEGLGEQSDQVTRPTHAEKMQAMRETDRVVAGLLGEQYEHQEDEAAAIEQYRDRLDRRLEQVKRMK